MKDELLEHIKCNNCGNDDTKVIYESSRTKDEVANGEFKSSGDEPLADPLVRCLNCGLEYVNPRLSPQKALECYASTPDEVFVSQASSRERTFVRCFNKIKKYMPKEAGSILDVGTANGSFLYVAKNAGWKVSGCEPNKWLCDWAERNYGVKIHPGTIFDARYSDSSFDVITLWDVLEHTPDPKAVLSECHRLLKPGGTLVVNYPDLGSWVARLMGKKWVFLLSVHYFYYTRSTIARALKNTAFNTEAFIPHVQTLELEYILFRAQRYVGAIAAISRKLISKLGMGSWNIPYWMGQTLVIAKKGK